MSIRYQSVVKAVLLILAALLSTFVLSKYAASPEFHQKTIEALDEKRTTVMELTAASTAASAAITLLPGDTATPIAEKLIDLSSYFLLVICAIYLEKYLVTMTGYAAFAVLIPLACVLLAVNVFVKSGTWNRIAVKLIAFALAIFFVIPASVAVSDLIERTYESSIQHALTSAKEATEIIEDDTEDVAKAEEGLLAGLASKVSGVKESMSGMMEKAEKTLNDFIEALAVLLVTSCVLPVLVLLFFVWITKVILGMELPVKKN